MAEWNTSSYPKPRRRGLRILLGAAGGLLALLVVAYFVVTSGAFLKGVVLPRVGKAINAEVTVGDVSLSPFSRVRLTDLKVQPKDAAPLLTAKQVLARYSLMDIIRGKITVEELTLVAPAISLTEDADGKSNLDPILQTTKSASPPTTASQPSKPLILDVKSVTLTAGTLSRVKSLSGGGQEKAELRNLSLKLTDLKNGQAGKLDLSADVAVDNRAPAPATNALLQASLKGGFTFELTQDLQPKNVNGQATVAVSQATGSFGELADLSANLHCDMTPTEIKQLALQFARGPAALGRLDVHGPFDATKLEGKLQVAVLAIDRQLLNFVGAAQGMDFGSSMLNSTNQIDLAAGGRTVGIVGQLSGASLSVARQGLVSPAFDLVADYSLTVTQAQQTALIKTLTLDARRNQHRLLSGSLAKPLRLNWAKGADALNDSAFTLTLSDVDLSDYRAFLGTNLTRGVLNAKLDVLSSLAGRELTGTLTSEVSNVSFAYGTNRIEEAALNLLLSGRLSEFRRFDLSKLDLKATQRGLVVVSAELKDGFIDVAALDASLGGRLETSLPALARLVPLPQATIDSGSLRFDGSLRQKNITLTGSQAANYDRSVEGDLKLSGFSGSLGGYRLENFEAALGCEFGLKNDLLSVRQLNGTLKPAGQAGGEFRAKGDWNLATQAGNVTTLTVTNLNQNSLRPFLASALGDKQLVTVAIGASLKGGYDPKGESSVAGELRLAKLVVWDPKGQLPATPLDARFKLDAALRNQVADLRDCVLRLTPTPLAQNELQLKGQVDFTRSNAIQGNLKLTAEALDVTSYYDLFAGKPQPTSSAPASPTPAPAGGDTEPAAVNLPVRSLTLEAALGRVYLRELDVKNLQAVAKLDGSQALVKPLQLTLNGAPVSGSAALNLGVPGFTYDLDLNARNVPLAPLVNSFQPERKGQFGGSASVAAHVKGAGVTGASLQKNLAAQFDLTATNLNLSVVNLRSPVMKSVINVIVGIPDFIRSPGAAVGNFFNRLLGAGGQRSGWADELTQSPIDVIQARGAVADGHLNLQQARVQSPAFLADAQGAINLAPVLTNSTLQIPLMVSLRRPLAEKVGLVPAGTPTNATYVKLPDFVTLRGTLGEPKSDINYLALTAVAAKAGAGIMGNTGNAAVDKATGVLGAVGSLLGGGPMSSGTSATNSAAATATNAPAPKPILPLNLLDLFKKKQ